MILLSIELHDNFRIETFTIVTRHDRRFRDFRSRDFFTLTVNNNFPRTLLFETKSFERIKIFDADPLRLK